MRDSTNGPRGRSVKARRMAGCEVRLSRVLPQARFIACDDVVVRTCRDDARSCQPGDVFVARLTARGDGHEAIPRAIARGASAIVAERMVSTDGVPLCLVPDSDWAHARLAHAMAGDPSREMRVIAVAGTSGKTTTAWLAAAVLAEAGHRVGVLSDLGCLGPDDVAPLPDDISAPPALAAGLARLSAAGCTHAIVEVSSRMLAAQATAGMVCDTVALTSLAAAHVDRHATPRAYRGIVARIMATLGDEGCLVTGLPARHRDRLLAAAGSTATCLTAGLSAGGVVHARPVEGGLFGRTFLLAAGGQLVPVTTATPTVPFVRDAVIAAGIGLRYGVSLDHAARGIEASGGVPGRLERIDRGQDAAVFVDVASSMHAVSATLTSLRRLTAGRLVVLVDEALATKLEGRRFPSRVGRWCDECLIVPPSIVADEPTPTDVAAYARVDRLLSSLGDGDCLVAFGAMPRGPRPAGPWAGRTSLAALVDGWLQLAHPAEAPLARRRAA